MNARIRVLVAILLLVQPLGFGSEVQAQSGERYERTARLFALGLRTSGIYDSNINHDEEDIDSQGVLAGIEARLQSGGRRPFLTLQYEGTLRRFRGTERWDRVEHEIGARLFGESGPLTLEARGQVDFSGATEDRNLGNQYKFSPRASLTVGPARLRGYGAMRLETIDSETAGLDPEQPDDEQRYNVIVYVGGEIRWKTDGGSSWTLGYRYEENRSSNTSRRYDQQRYFAEYEAEFTDRDELELGLEYRPRHYPDKLVEVERLDEDGDPTSFDEAREDVRWIPYVSLSHDFPWGQEIELEYEYQHRTSNDVDKEFEAHRLILTLRLPLVSRYRTTRIDE